jgi:hypothetical protein
MLEQTQGRRQSCRGAGRWTPCAQYRPVGRAVRPLPSERRSVDCGGIISRRWMTTRYAEGACSLGPVMGPPNAPGDCRSARAARV